jgi:hypothetical protein
MGSPVKTNTPVLERHVDIDALLEEYAWKYFRDMVGIKKSGLENFRAFERDEAEFTIVSSSFQLYIALPDAFLQTLQKILSDVTIMLKIF